MYLLIHYYNFIIYKKIQFTPKDYLTCINILWMRKSKNVVEHFMVKIKINLSPKYLQRPNDLAFLCDACLVMATHGGYIIFLPSYLKKIVVQF